VYTGVLFSLCLFQQLISRGHIFGYGGGVVKGTTAPPNSCLATDLCRTYT